MQTIFIHDTPVRVQDPFAEGHRLTEAQAEVLNSLWLNLLLARLRWVANKNPDIDAASFQSKARETAEILELSADGIDTDPVWDEAMTIGRELITSKLAAEGLPPPPNLDMHAEALLEASEDIIAQARNRVEIRRRVANQALGALEVVL
jgi:hypothetical protein